MVWTRVCKLQQSYQICGITKESSVARTGETEHTEELTTPQTSRQVCAVCMVYGIFFHVSNKFRSVSHGTRPLPHLHLPTTHPPTHTHTHITSHCPIISIRWLPEKKIHHNEQKQIDNSSVPLNKAERQRLPKQTKKERIGLAFSASFSHSLPPSIHFHDKTKWVKTHYSSFELCACVLIRMCVYEYLHVRIFFPSVLHFIVRRLIYPFACFFLQHHHRHRRIFRNVCINA